MSFLVWNCRGLAKPRVVRFLKEITTQIRPNLIFLSETLVRRERVEKVCKLINYAGCFVVDTQSHEGGLALLWKNETKIDIKGSCNHYIDFEVNCAEVGRWRYTGFYGCPKRQRRRESWNLLRSLADESDLPWCILGDFNDIMHSHEKQGGRPQPRLLMEGFKETIAGCHLKDMGYMGNEFTWERFRGTSAWIQERLDRGFSNQEWRNIFPRATIKVLEVSTSDHMPLFLEPNRLVYVPKVKKFRFENAWIREEQCLKVVQESWNQTEGKSIVDKVEYCCLKLEEWGGGRMQEVRKQIQECRRIMRQFRSRRDSSGVRKYDEARWEFLKLLEQQEVYWKQRSKQFWLREGDKNTKFFHKYATGRRKNNQIKKLKDKNGVWTDSKEGIQQVVTEYFMELFTTASMGDSLTDREEVNQVTIEQNQKLRMPITDVEVKNAVFGMHPDKSPGHNGLNPGFF
ncbi:uncharacterized protein LOC141693242 [Apium graveolens]|uniref:uncharacterized protein LOC141693242 n=1 Tax=Apium graveolens TaxID=4045 RepID=UPI003D7C0C62